MVKAALGVVLAALALSGCVYEQRASRDERAAAPMRNEPPRRDVRESELPPRPAGAPTPITAPPAPGAVRQTEAPESERPRTTDFGRRSPATGATMYEAEPERFARPASPPPASAHTQMFVQAATYGSRKEAERARRALAGLGPVSIHMVRADQRTRYRVRIGPLAAAESERVRAAAARRGYRSAVVVRE